MTRSQNPPAVAGFRRTWLLALAAAAALVAAARYFPVQDLLQQALASIGGLGPWGVVLFVAIYVVATVLFVPGSGLTRARSDPTSRLRRLLLPTLGAPMITVLMPSRSIWP